MIESLWENVKDTVVIFYFLEKNMSHRKKLVARQVFEKATIKLQVKK